MRSIVLIVIALGVIATLGLAVYARQYAMPPETWHVDPADVPEPDGMNTYLLRGETAPRLLGSVAEVADRLDRVARADGARLIAGSLAEGHVTYVVRSRVFGFPDAVSIRLHEDGAGTRVDIFSRSAMGRSDLGVNRSRVGRWIAAATQ